MNKNKCIIKLNKDGITIISLVIVVILLLILSMITIQGITNTGIFKSANQAKIENKRAQIIEYLKLKLMNEQTNNPFGSAEEIITATRNNVIENIEDLKKIGKEVTVEETSTEEDGENVDIYFYVIVDKDVYKVELDDVTFIGEQGEFLPVIKLKSISNTTNTITVKVTTKRNQGGKLEYYIKSEDEEEYKLIKTITEENYTYEGLTQNQKYTIKVIAIAENKKTAEVIAEQTTGKIVDLTEANAKFTYSPSGWTNSSVTATVSTEITGYTIQTSTDGENWTSTASQTLTTNGPVYARLWDGINVGGMLTGNITKIDKTSPTISGSATMTGANTATLSATINDKESGLSQIKWEWGNTTSYENTVTDKYVKMNSSSAGAIESVTKTKALTGLSAGTTYYVRITAYDVAGNITKSITTTFKTAVAKIGTKYYSSISDAINVQNSSTIDLLVNVKEKINIPSNKNITLNLNEKTITTTTENKTICTILNYGTLTLKGNGTINSTGNIGGAIMNYGTLTNESVTITKDDSYSNWLVTNSGKFYMKGGVLQKTGGTNGAVLMNYGQFGMTGGKIISNDDNAVVSRDGGNSVIEGRGISIQGTILNDYSENENSKSSTICKYATINGNLLAYGEGVVNLIDCKMTGNVATNGKVVEILTSSSGYNCYFYDTNSKYQDIRFPTWTRLNEQDDLIWHKANVGTRRNSMVWYYNVKKSEHNNESGVYHTDIYKGTYSVENFITGIDVELK